MFLLNLLLNNLIISFEQVVLSYHIIEVIKLLMLIQNLAEQGVDACLDLVLLCKQFDMFGCHLFLQDFLINLRKIP